MKAAKRKLGLWLAGVYLCWPGMLAAEPHFTAAGAPETFRDALVHEGLLYAAMAEHNAVALLDAATGEEHARIPVGAAPVALAVDVSGTVLACVNQDADSVSLISLPEHTPLGEVTVGPIPVALAALPDGRFAVANAGDGSLTLFTAEAAPEAVTVQDVLPVPSALAFSGEFLAVIGGELPAMALVRFHDTVQDVTHLALPAVPGAIASLGENLFAVATADNALALMDAALERQVLTRQLRVVDLAPDRGGLLVLAGDHATLFHLDRRLLTLDTWRLEAPATRILADEGLYLALEPRAARWLVHEAEVEAPAVPPREVLAEAVEEMREPEDLPPAPAAQEEPGLGAAVAPAEPLPEMPRPTEPMPRAMAPETAIEAQALAAQPVTQLAPSPGVRRHPLRTEAVRAPRSQRRPDAVPLRQLDRRTITDALVQPTEFGSVEAGFQAPDWTEPLRDIEAERFGLLPDGTQELEGQVQLRWGDMFFSSDRVTHTPELGELRAEGNVLITQRESRLLADTLHYTVPEPDEVEEPEVFSPLQTPQERERQRLMLGRLYARTVAIYEPTRSLVAEEITYDFGQATGEMLHVHGQADIYYFGADRIRILGPASLDGDDVWVTTCDLDPPHYRVRLSRAELRDGVIVAGTHARLQIGETDTPFYLPRWRRPAVGAYPWTFDFDSGRRAEVGAYLNVGQRFELTREVALGPRIYATEKEGVGFGVDMDYDFRDAPASRLYRTSGTMESLYTTKSRGFLHWYHRYDYSDDLVLRMQAEEWSDRNVYKDFYYDRFRNRSTPRTFANVTWRQERFIATGTAQVSTHGWSPETERLPEGSFHWLEQPLADRLYLSFDSFTGYNRHELRDVSAFRTVNVARLTYDWDPLPALSINPYVELEGSWYSSQRLNDGSAARASTLLGVTAQTRFHRTFPGFWGFSAFKHVVVPSVTFSHQPSSTLDVLSAPRFDDLDSVFGRSRIESKLANVVYGRDAETGEVWQVARLSLFQGNDLWNEIIQSHNYEIEMDIRPVRWMGAQLVAERHQVSRELEVGATERRRRLVELYERAVGRPLANGYLYTFDDVIGDYDRVLAQVYYDEAPLTGRLGFAYTRTRDQVYNREVLYGLGYELSEHWGIGFEHRYDFSDSRLRSQTYEIRRSLHCWETTLRVRDRESGFDVDLTFNIRAFPGSRLRL